MGGEMLFARLQQETRDEMRAASGKRAKQPPLRDKLILYNSVSMICFILPCVPKTHLAISSLFRYTLLACV